MAKSNDSDQEGMNILSFTTRCLPRGWYVGVTALLLTILLVNTGTSAQMREMVPSRIRGSSSSLASRDQAVGMLDVGHIKFGFFNDGRFVAGESGPEELPSALYYPDDFQYEYEYLGALELWVGVPDGPWAPEVWDSTSQSYISLGPSVSGTAWRGAADWGPVPYSKGSYYSGHVLFGDIYETSDEFNPLLLATSTVEESWPKDPLLARRMWPGRWRRDSTGHVIQNGFFGDQDIYVAFQDYPFADQDWSEEGLLIPNYGYSLRAEVHCTAVEFSHSYAKDIAIFDLQIVNRAKFDYHDVYLGLYYEVAHPYADFNSRIFRSSYAKVGYLLSDTSDTEFAGLTFDMSYSLSPGVTEYWAYVPFVQHVAVAFVKTPQAPANDQKDNDRDGVIDEPEGEELGLTGWHVSNRISYKGDLLQYRLMSGDTSGVSEIVNSGLFFAGPDGRIDPHFDPSEYLGDPGYSSIPAGWFRGEVPLLMSCGPVNWPRGDTLNLVFAVVMADSKDGLKSKVQIARKIAQSGYRRSEPPPPPKVTVVPADRRVTLFWDRSAEQAADFITGYQDFEGYRIYRTTKDPSENEWGTPIRDAEGKLVNFVPGATCDLKDYLKGYEDVYPFQKLGDDTGLFHIWVDTTVQNGITYWYSVCSYDHGILAEESVNPKGFPRFHSQECPKGTDPELSPNLVKVTPSDLPSNVEVANATIEALLGTFGNGLMELSVVDPSAVTGHTYLVTFEDTTFGFPVFDVYDEDLGECVVAKFQDTDGGASSVFDGIAFWVQRSDTLGISRELSSWERAEDGEPSECTWTIVGRMLSTAPFPYEYDIRFTDSLATGRFTGKTAPFVVWNTVLDQAAVWDIYYDSDTDTTDSLRNTWSSGDFIYIWDDFEGKLGITWGVVLREFGYTQIIRRVIEEQYGTRVEYDTVRVYVAPGPGDVAHVVTIRPFRNGDTFRITTKSVTPRRVEDSDLVRVRVVPNPYIVSATWDLDPGQAMISFVNLPNECDIDIYNLVGEKVYSIHHNSLFSDNEFWNLMNFSNMRVAYGMYLFAVRTPDGQAKVGKFAIIR